MKKKLLSLGLALIMTFGMITTALADFSDTSGHWAKAEIDWAVSQGLVKGDGNGKFRPNDPISKVEFYAVINRFINAQAQAQIPFRDVSQNDWFYPEVAKAVQAGYISGNSGEALVPNDYINRGNAFRILAHVYRLEHNANYADKFNDANKTSRLEKGAIGALANLGIIDGFNDGSIRPLTTINRGELCKILKIASEKLGKANAQAKKPVYNQPQKVVTNQDGTTLSKVYYKGSYYTFDELQRILARDYGKYYSGNIPFAYGDRVVRFYVEDKYGRTIDNPTITLNNYFASTTTLTSNTVKLTDGNYYFEISKPGYETFTGAFNIDGSSKDIKITLLPTGSRYDYLDCPYYGGCGYGPDHVKVKYVDNYGNEIAYPDYRRGYAGSTITVYSKFIPGYRLVSQDGVQKYIYKNSDNTVVFEYVKDGSYIAPDYWKDYYPPYWYDKDYWYGNNSEYYAEIKMEGYTSRDLEKQLNRLYPNVYFTDIHENTPTISNPVTYVRGYYQGYGCINGYCGWTHGTPILIKVVY